MLFVLLLVLVLVVVMLPPPPAVTLAEAFPPSPRKPTLVSAVIVDDTSQLAVLDFSVDEDVSLDDPVSMAFVDVDSVDPPDDPPVLLDDDVP